MTDTTKPDLDAEGFPVRTDADLDVLLSEPMLAYHPDAVAALLDDIARLQSDEPVSDEDAAFELNLIVRYPAFADWPARDRERAIRAGLIPDEPVDDEESDDGPDWPDDEAAQGWERRR